MKLINNKRVAWFFIVLSFIGFLDAAYLSIKTIFSSPLNCFIVTGCQSVANSPYSKIFGIPVAFFGAIFYLAIFLIAIRYLEISKSHLFKTVFYLSCAGVIFDIYLLFLQIFVIKALCIYCLISAVVSFLIFAIVLAAYNELKG